MTAVARLRASIPLSPLALWVAVQVVAAALVLLAVALTTPIDPGIALVSVGLRPDLAITAGLTFWLAFGLVGGLRTRLQPGGGVVTFSMPFIVAGTVLGGPLVGGLMGLVSEFEVRELQTRPWYGILSNHAVGILAGVGSGIVAFALRARLDQLLPGQTELTFFAVVIVAALAYTTTNVALVIPSLAIKNDLTLGEASRSSDATFRTTTVAEAILAWNLAASYALIAWWAPIVIVALVLAVWQAFDRGEALRHDPLTGLLNDLGFRPHLESALAAARVRGRPAAFLALDLDGLWRVNLTRGYAAGNELLRVSGQRMLRAVRATDSVSRKANTGDEFWILLAGVLDVGAALLVAERIQAAVRRPIHLRDSDDSEPLHAGVSIGLVLIEPGTLLPLQEIVDLGGRRLEASKCRHGEIVTLGDGPTEAEQQQRLREKAEERDTLPRH
ncbi:MAG TPA: GGDEF domain-containing protein [Candidatus Limnocylindrales bacterium]|nr:GGDEF domain-containing protein [Candidatus Limnocylindrales bacterium]